MIYVGIDIGKLSHVYSVYNSETGELIVNASKFENNHEGFESLIDSVKSFDKNNVLFGMEDTGHYHFTLIKYLFKKEYMVALINPSTTDLERRTNNGSSKTDNLDTLTIIDVLNSRPSLINKEKSKYRYTTYKSFDLYEQKLLTREHHMLKEQLNMHKNRLQKEIDLVFPEFNSLFKAKYRTVYMNILRSYPTADLIANTDIRSLRKCFELNQRGGRRISLTAEELKEAAKKSVGFSTIADELNIKHLVAQIELIESQLSEIDKKIEEFSLQANSPILSIPGISHFSGTSILAEIGDINNFRSYKQLIKYAGVAPYVYESSQYEAKHLSITKKGSKYLRKTLYQIITPVIQHNPVFKQFFDLKISQGKGYRCAQGHCVRKLLRIIHHILTTNQQFNVELAK